MGFNGIFIFLFWYFKVVFIKFIWEEGFLVKRYVGVFFDIFIEIGVFKLFRYFKC